MDLISKINQVITQHVNEEVNIDELVSKIHADDLSEQDEIDQKMSQLNASIKETLSYSDMTLHNCIDEIEEFLSLKKDFKRIESRLASTTSLCKTILKEIGGLK